MSSTRSRRGLVAVLALAPLLAACGSSATPSGGAAGGGGGTTPSPADHTKALSFASCMRSHGVPNFPDPKSNGSGGMLIQRTPGSTMVNGVSINGPAFQSAMTACRSKLPNGGHPQPLSAARRNQILAFSRCMRAHGLTNFPDPVFQGGRVGLQMKAGQGLDPNSPAFQAAQKACGGPFGKTTAAAP